jgi:hypothetical protein
MTALARPSTDCKRQANPLVRVELSIYIFKNFEPASAW